MSKSIAQMFQLLHASNEQLFDRYVDITLYQNKPKVVGASKVKKILSLDIFSTIAVNLGVTDFAIRTPDTGLKPSITVSGQFQMQNTVNLLNVTINNINANIDTMAYNYIEVEVGYKNSGISATFLGQITNCYMAKPNPNGELVISATNTDVRDLYARGAFEVTFPQDEMTTGNLIKTCLVTIATKYPALALDLSIPSIDSLLPPEWKVQSFAVGKSTRHFRSALECIAWMNSLFASCSYDTGYATGFGGAPMKELKRLSTLRLGFDMHGKLTVLGYSDTVNPAAVRTLSAIGSAFMTSTSSATVTAPFNPSIMPGDIVEIDARYFKTRVNFSAVREAYKSMGNLWRVSMTAFTFSTQGTNTMTLSLINITNPVLAQEG